MGDDGVGGDRMSDTSQLFDVAAFTTFSCKITNKFFTLHLNARNLRNEVDEIECFVNALEI